MVYLALLPKGRSHPLLWLEVWRQGLWIGQQVHLPLKCWVGKGTWSNSDIRRGQKGRRKDNWEIGLAEQLNREGRNSTGICRSRSEHAVSIDQAYPAHIRQILLQVLQILHKPEVQGREEDEADGQGNRPVRLVQILINIHSYIHSYLINDLMASPKKISVFWRYWCYPQPVVFPLGPLCSV